MENVIGCFMPFLALGLIGGGVVMFFIVLDIVFGDAGTPDAIILTSSLPVRGEIEKIMIVICGVFCVGLAWMLLSDLI